MPILELKNVFYTYEKGKAILQNVNAELEAGKMYAILGPSGCGKTTLLSLLGGLDVPTKGEVVCNGENINKLGLAKHRHENVSFIFQSYNLIDYPCQIRLNILVNQCEKDIVRQYALAVRKSMGKRADAKL